MFGCHARPGGTIDRTGHCYVFFSLSKTVFTDRLRYDRQLLSLWRKRPTPVVSNWSTSRSPIYVVKYRHLGFQYEMVDPTSDLGEDVSEAEAPTCAHCGESIVHSPQHRVITWIADGDVQSAHFCNEQCRMNWDNDA